MFLPFTFKNLENDGPNAWLVLKCVHVLQLAVTAFWRWLMTTTEFNWTSSLCTLLVTFVQIMPSLAAFGCAQFHHFPNPPFSRPAIWSPCPFSRSHIFHLYNLVRHYLSPTVSLLSFVWLLSCHIFKLSEIVPNFACFRPKNFFRRPKNFWTGVK